MGNARNVASTPGRRPNFQSEKDLVAHVAAFLRRTSKQRYNVLAEHEAGFGRPDLLLYSTKPDAQGDINTLSRLNPRFAPLLSREVSSQIKTLESLATISGSSRVATRRIAKELCELGRLSKVEGDEITVTPILLPPFPQVVAIEAKLRDWRRGLVQAYRYREFSTEAWVLLDHHYLAPAVKAADAFRNSGVGLATFSANADLFIHIPAQNSEWRTSPLAWRTQTMLARKHMHDH